MEYSVIPYVVGRFRVVDYGRGGAERDAQIQLLPAEPLNLQITNPGRVPVRNLIAQQLREQVEDALEVAATNGVGMLLDAEDDDGYPVKIVRDELQDANAILRNSYFQIVGLNGTPISSTGRERVFKLSPSELVYDNTKYFEPDSKSLLLTDTGKTASCAFQYIYQKFSNIKGFKKLAGSFKTIKRLATSEPPQFHTWAKWNKDELNVEKLEKNIQHGLPDLKSFEVDLVKVDVIGIQDDEWTDEELYNSLSVLDIIRWCMWAKVSCYVIDYDGNYYLSYNHNDIVSAYNDKKQKATRSIVLKVKDHHAYFVDDRNLKISTAGVHSKFRMVDFDNIGEFSDKAKQFSETELPPEKPEGLDGLLKYEKEMEKWRERNSANLYYSPFFKIRDAIQKGKLCGNDLLNEMSYIDKTPEKDGRDECIADISKFIYKHNPPPMPTDFLKDEDKTYYLQAKSLNGIISIIANQYGRTPKAMSGRSAHAIEKCSYGKTRLLSRNRMPLEELPSDAELDMIRKHYPNLSLKRIPTYTQIATEIFKKKYDNKMYSMLNSNTRRVFMDGEIKADNRVVKEKIDTEYAVCIDIRRAFTGAMRDMDVKWSKFDGICQFKKYKGYFNPNLFYLVKEIGEGYPLREGGGLKLYHGCFLRHLLGKGLVVIKYYISPVETLKASYFKEFVEDCEKIEDFNPKHLVNSFIGSMKKNNRITGFKFNHTESMTTLSRAFYTGSIVSSLDRNTQHNRDYRWKGDKPIFLMAKASTEYNLQTAQPIRLQIIDKINENLYKLYHIYKVCLRFSKGFDDPKLVMVRTDALYFEDAGNTEIEQTGYEEFKATSPLLEQVCRSAPMECKLDCPLHKDAIGEIKEKTPGIMLYPNRWRNQIDIDNPWTTDKGSKFIYNLINREGAWIQGEGGVGKSELMNQISKILHRNKIRYKFKKAILKEQDNLYWYQELEEWRNQNPCFSIKLAPTNKACNRIGGKTLNKGLGVPVMKIDDEEEEDEEKRISYFESIINRLSGDGFKKPSYDYVFVDEISMINGYMWSLLYYIKQRIPRVKFLLCGDIKRQLPPVGEEGRDFMNAYLIKELAGFTKINLNYNFRSGRTGNLLWDEWSVNPKRFKITPEAPDTLINLSYTNLTRKKVIHKLQEQLKILPHIILKGSPNSVKKPEGQTEELVILKGARLIACQSMSEIGVAKNEVWMVSDYDEKSISLKYEDDEIELTHEEVVNGFYSALCITIHKSQGDTYTERYTIYDWEKLSKDTYLNRKLRYVAQSRSKNPASNITYK